MTSLTFQNNAGVFGATHESAKSLRAQILPTFEESRIDAVKVGMLPTVELTLEVAWLIREGRLPAPVLDPVLKSSSGYDLIEAEALEVLKGELLPLTRVITPNIPEAEMLSGLQISGEESMSVAAAKLRAMGARAVLIKGGHAKADTEGKRQSANPKPATDLLDDGGDVHVLRGEWIETPPIRGTGCMLSAAIACGLAKGEDLPRAVVAAKQFVAGQIQNSRFEIQA
jgi:hydroxymethylpyrimidine kinase/phosphomethylpyrimidine kinase